jgi:membrane-bound metal-dependent hydrolase YbcI (DUF457 family)
MKLPAHVVGSAAVASAAYAATRSPTLTAAALLSGIFIDLDHLADFLLLSGEKFSVPNFFSWCEEVRWDRIFIVLHSIELLALTAVLAYWRRSDLLLGFVFGAGSHLLLDHVGNREPIADQRFSAWFYFLSYRWGAGFRKTRLIQSPDPG